jgi:osmotically-inducible protein OsmY
VAVAVVPGCAPAVVGGAAGAATVAMDPRSAGTQLDDQTIEVKTYDLVRRDPELTDPSVPSLIDPVAPPPELRSHIEVTSYNGVVLLVGETPSAESRERLASGVGAIDKVRRVHNELVVGAPSSDQARAGDALLTLKVRSRLLAEKDFDSDAVKVVTNARTVYLMGLVSRQQADIATAVARSTPGVERVVRLFEYLG